MTPEVPIRVRDHDRRFDGNARKIEYFLGYSSATERKHRGNKVNMSPHVIVIKTKSLDFMGNSLTTDGHHICNENASFLIPHSRTLRILMNIVRDGKRKTPKTR